MALASVAISINALEVCMSHALTTESEEIMGLLLGDVVDIGGQGKGEERLKARVWSVSLHRREQAVRSDDRVEISPEQLAAAAGEADRMTEELGIHTRVVGWYHSHPHLAVVPSHVDVRTQAQYQQMDSAFVGLIFSVFNSGRVVPGVATGTQELADTDGTMMVNMNSPGSGRVQATAFQSRGVDAGGRHLPPLPPHSVSNWAREPPADWPFDPQTSSPSSYIHKEVGLEVVAEGKLLPDRRSLPCLSKLSLLQIILREEERQAFLKSVAPPSVLPGSAQTTTLANGVQIPVASAPVKEDCGRDSDAGGGGGGGAGGGGKEKGAGIMSGAIDKCAPRPNSSTPRSTRGYSRKKSSNLPSPPTLNPPTPKRGLNSKGGGGGGGGGRRRWEEDFQQKILQILLEEEKETKRQQKILQQY